MNLKLQLTQAFFLSLLSIIAFGLVAFLISEHKIARFDEIVIAWIQGLESPALTRVMKGFTFIGSTPAVIVLSFLIMVFLYVVLQHRSELVLFVTVVAGTGILNQVLKLIFHRPRPFLHRLVEAGGYSFPSGHSMEAFALYAVLAFLLWRYIATSLGRCVLIVFSVCMILAIGISRVYLGVHYPSDVLGGYFASGFWLAAAIWIYQRYKERQSQSQ